MALTAKDLVNIKRLIDEIIAGKDFNKIATKADLSDLSSEVKVGLENIVDTITELSPQHDSNELPISKRLERLEKIVL